jgi:phosphoribosylformimino-5-aminoimidazole carboxamide ribotide isomerase
VIAYAAVDLKGGAVVQLVGGRPEEERVRLPDPAAVALRWQETGFAALHVVDLDAALGSGSNMPAIDAVLAAVDVPVQVGGGVRDEGRVAELLAAGAARVVVGTRAIEDRAWLTALATRHPGRIVVAADVRAGHVVTRGWTVETGLDGVAFIEALAELPLAGVLVTDVSREGRMEGIDADLFQRLCRAAHHPVLASGGITDIEDMRTLAGAGAAGAVLGMALYTGALDAGTVAREFGQ